MMAYRGIGAWRFKPPRTTHCALQAHVPFTPLALLLAILYLSSQSDFDAAESWIL
jgi:hypothetical protein